MRSSNRQYMAGVDHLRGFAALLVLFYHSLQLLTPRISGLPVVGVWIYSKNPLVTVLAEGHTAVTLFMVLSGFIFTVGTLGHGVSFPRFMGNRLLRIYPLFLLLVLIGSAFAHGSVTPGSFFLTVFGLGDYDGAMNLGAVSAMFWAVAIEMQFYLMFPLLNKILTKSGWVTLLRLLAAVVVVRAIIWVYAGPHHDPQSTLYFNLAGRIDDFLIGMIAAWFFVHHRSWFKGWWKVGISVVIVLATLWEFNQKHGSMSTAMWRLPWIDWEAGMWALVILTYVATLKSTNILSRTAARIGEMSFSIYLLHFVCIQVIEKEKWYVRFAGLSGGENAFFTALLVLTPIVLVASWFTYNGVEKPFLNLRMRYLTPLEEAATVPATGATGSGGAYRGRHEPAETVPAETVPAETVAAQNVPVEPRVPVQSNGHGNGNGAVTGEAGTPEPPREEDVISSMP